jgi:hypothetical protein
MIMGFDTHMILEAYLYCFLTRRNGHQAINPTSRHYAEALGHSQRNNARPMPFPSPEQWPQNGPCAPVMLTPINGGVDRFRG